MRPSQFYSEVNFQEQNKMLADSAEGARREVPQLMQVGSSELEWIFLFGEMRDEERANVDDEDLNDTGAAWGWWSSLMQVRKRKRLVIMASERVARIMRVRRKKWVGTSSSRVITSNGIKDFRERQIQIQRQERSWHGIQHFNVWWMMATYVMCTIVQVCLYTEDLISRSFLNV